MKNILIIVILLSFGLNLKAQKKGDQEYDKLGYLTAAELYQDMEADQQTYEVKWKLANSYRLNSEYEAAEYWYAQIINEAQQPETVLHYAQMLQANGKCEDAIRWYKAYASQSEQESRSFIEDCAELKQFTNHEDIDLENMATLNSEYHDFSPIPHKDGIVFTSMRGDASAFSSSIDPWTKSNFSDLFYATKSADGFDNPATLKGDVNGGYHDGVATFSVATKQMIFTRTSKEKSTDKPTKKLKIYTAKETGSDWKNTEELTFNSKEYSSCHPTISVNGQRLYFASDRAGGFGGMDIYVSPKVGNKWGEPINLGPTVNTAGNEIFPFVAKNGKLFFASDGHKGLGGLDIFVVEKVEGTDENSFIDRKNLGTPFNSQKDDFGFYINQEETEGYLSSNRPGGAGEDDIYRWSKKHPNQPTEEDPFDPNPNRNSYSNNVVPVEGKMYEVAVCDASTGQRLPNAKVAILKSGQIAYLNASDMPTSVLLEDFSGAYSVKVGGGQVRADASFQTNENGQFNYYLSGNETHSVYIERNQYYPSQQTLNYLQLSQSDYCIPLQPRKCIPLSGAVKNRKFPKYLAGATVILTDKCTGVITNLTTDINGAFEFCLECDCEYEIKASKTNFISTIMTISTLDKPCSESSKMNTLLELDLEERNPNEIAITKDYVNEYFTGTSEGNYQVGDVITLNNIYYDFDKYNIRSDAQYELDYLITLMNNYPSMEIRLRSHTDSRGKGYYNKWLSRKRANTAKEYLIKSGIQSYRIEGYDAAGETELVNDCGNDVDCSEEAHQANRRTEIVITRIDESVQIINRKSK